MEIQVSYFKDDAVKVSQSICQQIWKTQQWPQDWKRSVFIPIQRRAMPKNVQTTTQLHSSHMLVKSCSKLSKPGFSNTWTMNFQMFKLDLEKAEKPDIKLPISTGSRKSKRIPEKHLLLLYWLHQSLWLCRSQQTVEIFQEMGIPDHFTCLLRNLYAGQEATVRTGHRKIDWFQIGKGVCQGCILSPYSS